MPAPVPLSTTARLVAVAWGTPSGFPAVLAGLVAGYADTPAADENDFEAYEAADWPRIGDPVALAGARNDLRLLAWARADSSRWTEDDFFDLAQSGSLGLVRWAFAAVGAAAEGAPAAGRGALLKAVCLGGAAGGHIPVMRWARAADKAFGAPSGRRVHFWGPEVCTAAAASGRLPALQWVRARGCTWDRDVWRAAAMAGSIEMLQWLRDEGAPSESASGFGPLAALAISGDRRWDWRWTDTRPAIGQPFPRPLDPDSLEAACREPDPGPGSGQGYRQLSRRSRGRRRPRVPESSRAGRLALLRWAMGDSSPADGLPSGRGPSPWWGASALFEAAAAGDLEMLRWAHASRFPWPPATTVIAAYAGHRIVLEWAHAEGLGWDPRTCEAAAASGDLELLRWVRGHDEALHPCGPWGFVGRVAAAAGALPSYQWALGAGCPGGSRDLTFAAEGGHFDLMRWGHERGTPLDEDIATGISLAQGVTDRERLRALQWAFAEGAPPGWVAITEAATRGDLLALCWMSSIGRQLTESVCSHAAVGGHLGVLRWIRSRKRVPAGGRLAAIAAGAGHLRLVQWICTRKRKQDPRICKAAAAAGHLAVFRWACERGYPWDGTLKGYPVRPGAMRVLAWARANGYPRAPQK